MVGLQWIDGMADGDFLELRGAKSHGSIFDFPPDIFSLYRYFLVLVFSPPPPHTPVPPTSTPKDELQALISQAGVLLQCLLGPAARSFQHDVPYMENLNSLVWGKGHVALFFEWNVWRDKALRLWKKWLRRNLLCSRPQVAGRTRNAALRLMPSEAPAKKREVVFTEGP